MPITSRRTRRLLKLLFKVPNKGYGRWVGSIVFPIIVAAGCFALAYFLFGNDETRSWSWLPILYLWVERSHSNLEREMKRVCESNEMTRRQMYSLKQAFGMMRIDNRRVQVDMPDFVREARKYTDNQRRHEDGRYRRR